MPHDMTPELITELEQQLIRPVVLCEAEFVTGMLRVWSGQGSIAWNGQTWLGTGSFGEVSPATETAEIRADSFTISFSALRNEDLQRALAECRPNMECSVWFGCLRADGTIVADPTICAKGLLDVPTVDDGVEPNTSRISITVETRQARLQTGSPLRYTDECQQLLYPGDDIFKNVTDLQEWNGCWGLPGTGVPRTVQPGSLGVQRGGNTTR